MKKSGATLLLGLSALLSAGFSSHESHHPSIKDNPMKGSYRFERDGWIFVHLEGSPDQIGYQHGKLLAKETEDLLRVLKPFLLHETKKDWSFYRKASQDVLWAKIDVEFQQEMDGIVRGLNDSGVKADRWDIVALNAVEELPYYYVPWQRYLSCRASRWFGDRQHWSADSSALSWERGGYRLRGYVVGSLWCWS